MNRYKRIVSLYGMHSSGSWVILNTLLAYFPKYFPDTLFILPSICPRTIFDQSGIQPVYLSIPKTKIGRLIHSVVVDQLVIPLLALCVRANQIFHFGNVASYLSPCPQKVFFHNALFLPVCPLKSKPSAYLQVKRRYVLLSLLASKASLFVQNYYMKSQFLVKDQFKNLKVSAIGNPFPTDVITNKGSLKYSLEIEQKCLDIKSKFKHMAFYPSFPHSYKNHSFLLDQIDYFALKSIHVVFTCSLNSLKYFPEIVESKLSKTFTFLGPLVHSDLELLYQICDLILFPSSIESLGMPIIEAAIYKKPLLAPSLHYVTSSVKNAYLYDVNSGALPFSFTDKCNQLVEDLECHSAKLPVPMINILPSVFLQSLRGLA